MENQNNENKNARKYIEDNLHKKRGYITTFVRGPKPNGDMLASSNTGENNLELKAKSIIDLPMRNTIMAPLMTGGLKMISAALISPTEHDFIMGYLAISSVVDIGELCYRVYLKEELGPMSTVFSESNPEEDKKAQEEWNKNSERHLSMAKPFSCLEKHIFYDLPKYIYKKLGRNKNDQ